MQAPVRRLFFSAACMWAAIGCSGVESGNPYGHVYYGTDWYYADDWYPYYDDDISLPDRPDIGLKPEHPIVLPKGSPPQASQLPSGIDRPGAPPSAAAPRPTPSPAARLSIPSMPRGGGGMRGGGGGRRR
jgi:hypothetical protein